MLNTNFDFNIKMVIGIPSMGLSEVIRSGFSIDGISGPSLESVVAVLKENNIAVESRRLMVGHLFF